jgi:hypothetical protein
MDFRCWRGTYDIKSIDELPAKDREYEEKHGGSKMNPTFIWADIDRLFLVETGPPKAVPVKRKALEYAVGLLLKTDGKLEVADNISKLKRNVFLISRQIGMLESDYEPDDEPQPGLREDLSEWIRAARRIQFVFQARDLQGQGVFSDVSPEEAEIDSGFLQICISYHSHRPSIRLRPDSTRSALFYCAAQMIARGVTAHACDNCDTAFLGGGERNGRNKKRAGSRFCSDTCRYEYHNERRRKAKAKS